MNIIDELKSSFRTGNMLTKLIYANLGVFLLIQLIHIFARLFGGMEFLAAAIDNLAVPTYLPALVRKPWTVISYMFTHFEFMHILMNLLWLYWFGKIFLSYLSERQLLSVYILGGLSGALLYILSYNLFPALKPELTSSTMLGASAAVMAIIFSIAFMSPDYRVYVFLIGPVKIIHVALVVLVLTSLVEFSVNTGGKIAHIGGAAFGYFYTYRYNRGKDISVSFSRFTDWIFSIFKPKSRMKVTHKKPVSDEEYNQMKNENQKEIDRILDKISQKGYNSLSKEEKEILFKMGKK